AIDAIPPAIPWPDNLFILGTVNMDETTHAFSDKVLDRAFTFEFWEVDHQAWRRAKDGSVDGVILAAVYDPLAELYQALHPCRRHFGYRTFDEVLNFCRKRPERLHLEDAIDAAIFAKVLPKIRGDDS